MQIVEVNLIDGYPFYCPVTGTLILSEDEFTASPAMVYCYIQNESTFEYTNGQAQEVFSDISKGDFYLNYEKYNNRLHSLTNDVGTENWVCFRLCSGRNGSFVVDHCIDMGFRESLNNVGI
ncbi:hypothetical protein [Gelidibacter maritimus]|uniref:Uncharacterized protein n=1 Tax=Gelidibacter maritimus TaxID=2761487 RepID=A0A7W2M2C1_9FLAO|nr:hypothetical protein [Gelidibacter maritimus]MBA6151459.1 hypothetical protein [Gelidibacter maritimus]